ncbi:MAG: translation elongation factor 4 [Planctomycetes bacterium]|nr:translation elongation factor 4 [Planctomycetota bacterium]
MSPSLTKTSRIRNFCIIAHIDHGKSTLADRMLEISGTINQRQRRDQLLDDMDLERERGITIKAKAVEIAWEKDGEVYMMHLIDTPGHVDFSYEVSRSMAACEGAVLLVDAAQGVEAQTAANTWLAVESELEILPVLNKVDLPVARPDEVKMEIETVLGLPGDDVEHISAKTGAGVKELLDKIVSRIPPPQGDPDAPLQTLIFDSVFDDYRGVIVYVRVVNGTMKRRDRIRMIGTQRGYEILELGKFRPDMKPVDELSAGEVGYVICNIKTIHDVKIGDTITHQKTEVKPLPGYKEPVSYVYCGLYPSYPGDYDDLRTALERLHLNDASFNFLPETSDALGFGFRAGFLGLLHMEIVQERLEREGGIDLIQTPPNVTYRVIKTNGVELVIDSPSKLPDDGTAASVLEPIADVSMITPSTAIGPLMKLCEDRRGTYIRTEYLGPERVLLHYELPLSEIIFDFYDKLKSATQGYGTMDYHVKEYRAAALVRLRVMVNGADVDALSMIVHRDEAARKGRSLLIKLKKEIPRHMFEVPLQVAIGGKIIARETISAMRKNVTAKCYGGDITRKRKLLEKQKEGKRRMKSVGNVEIPQSAFFAALKLEKD